MNEKKIKVLTYADAPTCATGFGTVSRNVLEALHKTGRYAIDVLGINYWGDPHSFPYRIWPVGTNQQKDPYGRKKICNMIPKMDYDILFFLQDTFILDFLPELIPYLKQNRKEAFGSVVYYPIDGFPKQSWIKNVSVIDNIVAYTEFGKKAALDTFMGVSDEDISVIPHGVNISDYYPLPKKQVEEFRNQYFGKHADKFIFMNLNRNQQRKDIPRTIQAFVEFRKQVPESILYLHMAQQDQGWNLAEVCAGYGLSTSEDVIFPENFGPNQGYPRQVVNALYSAVDCVVSTVLGEGFGLGWLEAMATNTPIIMPDNTAMSEHITEDRGYLAKSGTNSSLWTVLPNDNEVRRPLVDVDDMVEKMLEVHNDRAEAKRRANNAYKWVTTKMNWQGEIGTQWVNLFDNVYEDVLKSRSGMVNVSSPNVEGKNIIESESF